MIILLLCCSYIALFRSFLRPVEKRCAKYPSGIKHTLVLAGALEDYTKLNMKSLAWPVRGTDEEVSYVNISDDEDIATPPPAKRIQIATRPLSNCCSIEIL